ncbi:MAG: acyltransferase [Acidobacteria bacterium]|nr:MAG: acyltransferase [Acidobacteriota bacterium]
MNVLTLVHRTLKVMLDAIAIVLMSPLGACCGLERRFAPRSERVFDACAQTVALFPGLPGMILRRGFYRLALDSCARDCFIGFGAIFTHRAVSVESGVYIGPYSMIASSRLRQGCLIASRVSILSGGMLHARGPSGQWLATNMTKMVQIEIGEGAWLGEGAIVIANVGAGAMVGAGSVVPKAVPARVMVAGNPARTIRELETAITRAQSEEDHASLASTC